MRQTQSSPSNEKSERSKPARVLLHFISGLLAVVVLTFLLGELNLPYYGATAWDLVCAMAGYSLRGVMVAATWSAGHFVFTVGALGVLWLTRIHLRVQRTHLYEVGGLDFLFAALALALIVVYFVGEDQVLPLHASAIYRIALYSAISLTSFGFVAAFWEFDAVLSDVNSDWAGLLPCTAIAMVVVGIATGQHGAEHEAPFFSYRVLNAVLHLLATLGAFAMASWFQCELDDHETARLEMANAAAAPATVPAK